jgi:hypothetical protein
MNFLQGTISKATFFMRFPAFGKGLFLVVLPIATTKDHFMNLNLLALISLMSVSALAQPILSSKTDEKFGGYYVDVTKSVSQLSKQWGRIATISDALHIQNALRDCLESKSGSFLRIRQAPFLKECLSKSEEKIHKHTPKFADFGLTVVFDMDETLLTQWHKIALENPQRTTIIIQHRDHVLSESKREVTLSPRGITIRPGMTKVLATLVANPKVGQIVFFTAREDRSGEELRDYFLSKVPSLKAKFGGLLTRNFLRLDDQTNTPSKDLRIISPGLKNIILIDDNTSRVMQKDLNFTIPKFNADLYLEAIAKGDRTVIEANNMIAPFVSKMINHVTNGGSFSPYSTATAERNMIDWGKKILEENRFSPGVIEELIKSQIFHQNFFGAETIKR